MDFLIDNISHTWSQFNAGRIKHLLRECTGKGLWKLAPGFLHSSHVPFPFADFVLYPFAVITHSCKYSSLLSSRSPSKSGTGGGLEEP